MSSRKITLGTIAGTALALTLALAESGVADVVGFEDFDGGDVNLVSTTNVLDYGAGGGSAADVFGRVSPFAGGAGLGMPFDVADDSVASVSGGAVFPGDTLGIAGQNGSAFFAMNDMDGSGAPGFTEATWTFGISSAIAIDSISIDLAAMGNFEAGSTDGFLIEAQIDGGGYQEIFRARTDEDGSMVYRAMDDGTVNAYDDPLALFIDGSGAVTGFLDKSVAATGQFDSYVSVLLAGASGTTLDIRVSWAGTPSGGEPMGIDNITINGTVPTPGALTLLCLACLARRRRRNPGRLPIS